MSSFQRPRTFLIRVPALPAIFKTAGLLLSCTSCALLFDKYILHLGWGSGSSMYPTMPSEGSVVIISKLHARGHGVKVGDLIQAKSPLFPKNTVGKRVIGMPGDYVVSDPTVSARTDYEDSVDRNPMKTRNSEPMMIEVPEGHVWLVGDNLNWSRDSRVYGPLPMALIEGKIIAIRKSSLSGWNVLRQEPLLEVVEEAGVKK